MKKITDYIKPNILIIFGALLLVMNLDALSATGAGLALGIVAIIMSVYYLFVGILLVLMGNKLSPSIHKILDAITISFFALYMFVSYLLTTIDGGFGPTGWVINILSMVAAIALVIVYIMYKFTDQAALIRFVSLFALIFVLALLLDVLFAAGGLVGRINIFLVAIYAAYSFYLFSSLGKIEDAPKQAETVK
ncbi:MAG: hypothetical protein J5911_05720 [Clostridia bacterium]|nr:hypothetical protein [Clostridia bacterium]